MAQEFLYGVRTRRVASAGLDPLTPMLLIAYVLVMVGGGIYGHVQLKELIEQQRVADTFTPGVLWTMVIAAIVLMFAVVGPLVLLGVFAASKIMKFPLSGAAYLKACGVATVPGLVITAGKLLPPNFVLILVVMVAIIPLTYFVLKSVFELTFPEGALSFVLSGITGVIGFAIAGAIIGALGVGGVVSNQMAKAQGGPQTGGVAALPGVTPPSPIPSTPRTTPNASNSTPSKSAAETFRETLAARVAQSPNSSREQQQQELAALKARAEALGATKSADVLNMLQDLEARAAAAPSEKPEATLFQEPVAGAVWRPTDAQLGQLAAEEISFEQFNLRLPKGFRADLNSSEGKALSFSAGRGESGKLVLRTAPAGNAKQRRPWVTTQLVQTTAAARDGLFTIDGTGATVDEGTINGVAFTRVVHEPGKRFGVHGKSAQYVTRTTDGWVVLEAVATSGGGGGIDAIEGAIRTLRQRPAGDPVTDPLAPELLAARLAEDPDRVAKLLRDKGKAAEAAVIPQLSNADARAARAAASVLGDVGSEKSVLPLQEAAKSRDSFLAAAAREALKKIQPETMDAVTEALLELEGGDVFKKREALDRLAKTPPDEARREKVAAVLEALCLGHESFHLGESLDGAMAAWAGKMTVPRLLPMLEKNAGMHERRLAMSVFAKLKDERAVLPIIRWVIYDTDNVTKTLIEMGPVAEPELIKTLKDPNATARTGAARVLQEIGTVRSLATLKRASLDQRDPGAAAAARVALDIVSERVKAAKATATTAPTGK